MTANKLKNYILRCAVVLLVAVLGLALVSCNKQDDNSLALESTPQTEDVGATVSGENTTENDLLDLEDFSQIASGDTTKPGESETEMTTNPKLPYLIKVNRQQNIVTVYVKNAYGEYTIPYKAMVCSVGFDDDTPTGTFQIYQRYKWLPLYGGVYGQYSVRFNGPILFHSVPYYTADKGDLKYNEYNKLGNPASQGCVRLSVADAKWIYDNCANGTVVTVYDSAAPEPLIPPAPIRIDTSSPNRGWDPTDPDAANPWRKGQPATTTTTKPTTTAAPTTAKPTTTAAPTTTTTTAASTTTAAPAPVPTDAPTQAPEQP